VGRIGRPEIVGPCRAVGPTYGAVVAENNVIAVAAGDGDVATDAAQDKIAARTALDLGFIAAEQVIFFCAEPERGQYRTGFDGAGGIDDVSLDAADVGCTVRPDHGAVVADDDVPSRPA